MKRLLDIFEDFTLLGCASLSCGVEAWVIPMHRVRVATPYNACEFDARAAIVQRVDVRTRMHAHLARALVDERLVGRNQASDVSVLTSAKAGDSVDELYERWLTHNAC